VALFEFDERLSPLVLVTTPAAFEDEAFEQAFRDFEGLFVRRARYALVIDTTAVVHVPSAKQRRRISEWEKAHVDETRRWNVATAMVVSSSVVRGVLTALSWIVPDETPRTNVAKRHEAIEWCCAHLEAAGIVLPAVLQAHRRGGDPGTRVS
jgi:hypothetical protein